ncbi:MAG: radical SAM protein, partial [Actinomycetota bacterium]
ILTKGTLILRDLDRLAYAAQVMDVSTAFSIGTLDEDVWRKSEPGTPHPRKRVAAVQKLNEAGIPCGVLIAPVLPGLSDGKHQLREVVTACIDAGATHVSPILLHLRPKVREVYMEWLAETYPELVPRYEQMYTRAYASSADKKALSAMVAEIASEHPRPRPLQRRPRRNEPPKEMHRDIAALKNEQMSLL